MDKSNAPTPLVKPSGLPIRLISDVKRLRRSWSARWSSVATWSAMTIRAPWSLLTRWGDSTSNRWDKPTKAAKHHAMSTDLRGAGHE